jgi:hypothetical protein
METYVFTLAMSLLLLHEMDAIRLQEWKMFIILKNLHDETAYRIFLLAHLPLYMMVIFVIAIGGELAKIILYYVVDIFLVAHSIIHYGFRKNPDNGFVTTFSQATIYSMGILAVIHLCCLHFI